jgi:ComF family protein
VYEGVARKAVHTLKFRSGRYLVPVLGELMRAEVSRRPLAVDLVVPAPLAPGRYRRRGFNQAALLAAEIADAVGGRLAADVLAREDRPAQQALRAQERLANVRGAFTCLAPDEVRGKRILLVDDVLTTGATLGEAAHVLDAAGATWIGAFVFARDL